MPNFENAFNTVCELVKDFKENENIYLSYKYNESQARKDFIDKFFIALGWDVNHTVQKNPHKQEVLIEQTLDNQSRPDYTFSIDPNFNEPIFYVEAKKPSRDLLNSDYYFQAINYARFSNTPVTVLTDFEEFHILDSRYKPNINTVLKDQNHLVFKYNDYSDREKFAVIYYLFSRDNVANNSIKDYSDKLAANDRKRKKSGYTKSEPLSIDEEFLLYLDNIRVRLAKAFKKADASLSSEELTEATQRTIDRLVFIRFLEDKNIEPEDFVSKLGTSNKSWSDFINICRKLDAKYNGIVFKEHFIDNQNFGGPELNDFKNVCFEFSRKNSQSYNYNLIPIHILGSIYERFLGKVVNATAQRVKVEEKPEVRKAGGVYYTPKYIVDYIVKNTIGKLIEDKSPKEISKLRFADIACGSGSFLIGVFETILDYHNNYYWINQDEAKKDGCIFKDGVPVLSIKQKQNILLNNIYGVDIDPQAVEVTQLSLALKMLEDESLATANQMQVLFHEQILPNLSKNIICGNSLIGTDIIYEDSSEAGLFDRKRRITVEEERKLNPLDFDKRFFEIMRNGGFDAIVGNPPYVMLQNTDTRKTFEYALTKYICAKYKIDTYQLFIEKSISLLNSYGLVSFITPNAFLKNIHSEPLRKYILTKTTIKEFMLFNYSVFKSASVDVCIFIFNRTINIEDNFIIVNEVNSEFKPTFKNKVLQQSIIKNNKTDFNLSLCSSDVDLINKLINNSKRLSLYCSAYFGIQTFDRKTFVATHIIDSNYKPVIDGANITPYNMSPIKEYIKFVPEAIHSGGNNSIYTQDRICVRQIGNYPIATLILSGIYTLNTIYNIYMLDNKSIINIRFLLGIINSKPLKYYWKRINSDEKKLFPKIKKEALLTIPIPDIPFENKAKLQSHDKIVTLVNEMLEAKKLLQTVKTDRDKIYYENKCTDLDHAIDSEVYKLYGLTEEEIKIVEGKE